ncbi:uncharacterized protein F4807DRAFT_470052 [Annulohypoxylon truncatum]|uniref:uncharacterized protein n=1 Tax=Annulohypoxylon truncatum TaxID=327061 RepID=UPI002008B82B|nr:uncharacterized protein F4807DRAFT_470052 [Annulohypoxylon truncatum]KAI1206568.1 hypothetical protein F4807DRAFT_470052 [Annulohypoxylon truncatum]
MGVLIERPAEQPAERPVERPASSSQMHHQLLYVMYIILYGTLSLAGICAVAMFMGSNVAKDIRSLTDERNMPPLLPRTTPTEPAVPMPTGAPLFDLPRSHVGDVPYGVPIFTCANPGQIALTFNEGPSEWTQTILDALDHYDFKGTFFIAGSAPTDPNNNSSARHTNVDDPGTGWPALLSRIHESGHQIASHTYTHARLDGDGGAEALVNEMVYNEMALRNAFGLIPAYMRPPYGVWRDPNVREQLEGLGYHVIMHNLDTHDYEHDGPEEILKSVDMFNDIVRIDGNGSYIVQMQDSRQWTAMVLVPAILESMVQRGYQGVTVGECLDDAFFYWYRQPEP